MSGRDWRAGLLAAVPWVILFTSLVAGVVGVLTLLVGKGF